MISEPSAASEEVDVWWGGYSGWAMLPSFVICALLTLAAVSGGYLLWTDYGQRPAVVRDEFYVVTGLLWLVQLLRWTHPVVGITYRLTTRRLFCGEGFLYPRRPHVELTEIGAVLVEQTAVERWLGIGRLRVVASRAILLPGVRDPHRIAAIIGHCAERAQKDRVQSPKSKV